MSLLWREQLGNKTFLFNHVATLKVNVHFINKNHIQYVLKKTVEEKVNTKPQELILQNPCILNPFCR